MTADPTFETFSVEDKREGKIQPREDPVGLDILLATWVLNYDLILPCTNPRSAIFLRMQDVVGRGKRVWAPEVLGPVEPPADAAEVLRIKRGAYNNFDLEGFKARRRDFDCLDLSTLGADVIPAVEQVLSSRPNAGFVFPTPWDEVPTGQLIWRARRVSERLRARLEQSLVMVNDLWEPPKVAVSPGRLNIASEPLLYGCLGYPPGSLAEARIVEPRAPFLLTRYEVLARVVTCRIGSTNKDPQLTPHPTAKLPINQTVATTAGIQAAEGYVLVWGK